MIEIDGSMHSGSGTILRYSAALATLVSEPLHVTDIRVKRPKPGLRAQHLQALEACRAMSEGTLEGAEIGSREIFYRPGPTIKGGNFKFDIGTAGSATMAAFALIPIALHAQGPSRITIIGGLFQDFAPTFFHMQKVLEPLIGAMGAETELHMVRPGYVPTGNGALSLVARPMTKPAMSLDLTKPLRVKGIKGIALSSNLREQNVSERMANRAIKLIEKRKLSVDIELLLDSTAPQKGAALTLWADSWVPCYVGADQAGKPGRSSERIAEFVVRSLFADLDSGATVDRHIADQLILHAALAKGTTRYLIPEVTDHVQSNLWLVEKILGATHRLTGNLLEIHGIGFE
jgi:RNA 3'-terminal phosphate cyclase (ATP)